MEEWITIREWARQGVPLTEIARRTGHDPKTVRKVLRAPAPTPRASTWKPDASKLAPFHPYLLGRVDQGCLNAMVLLEEIAQQGYSGKITILRDFLRPIRQELRRKREATERFETGPGKQAQVDWGDFGRIWQPQQARWQKLSGFVFTLGYSRAQYLEFVTSCDLEHFLGCHLAALTALGIPEQILYDNLKTAILGRHPDGSPIFPGRFLDFALYYGFTPKFCRPYRARTKGKVERGIGYVRQNFWVRVAHAVAAGQLDLAELNARAQAWTTHVANERVHGTTGVVVRTRYAEEQPLLGSVTTRPPYDTAYHALRRVGRDGRLSYRGQLYQVPLEQALGAVQVEERLDGTVTIRSADGRRLPATRVTDPSLAVRHPTGEEPAARPPDRTGALVLGRGHAVPVVQTRDLRVYEEVLHAVDGA